MTHSLENRISESSASRFWQELFRNTGQFPIAIILLEFLKDGSLYLTRPDFYILVPSSFLQAYFLSRKPALSPLQKFLGNLIAPALYTIVETMFEGWEFFTAPQHNAYWMVAAAIALLQSAQVNLTGFLFDFLLIIENVIRAQILFILYIVFEGTANPAQVVSFAQFFSDTSHRFIGLATLLLGISVGFANTTSNRYLLLLRQTASQLRIYSEWLLGRDLLGRAINDPNAMTLSSQTRTVMFMDIRGFTHWSEKRAPKEVADLLNDYYLAVEKVLERYQVIKYKFTADEVMAVFIDPQEALHSALEIRSRAAEKLGAYGLGAGIGIHTGLVVEGLLGAQNVRFYDVLGDTVNTASRIEKNSGAGELWISEDTRAALARLSASAEKEISAKGKELPIKVYLIP